MPATRSFVITLAFLLSSAVPTAAQGWKMPEEYRAVQLKALETQRILLLKMADSMPEALYRDRITPIQRDFAQQVQHAAGAAALITAGFIVKTAPPTLPDTAVAANSRAALKGYVNAAYDYAVGVLKGQSLDDRHVTTNLFGTAMPKWQVWDEINQHTMWTAGQIVANFRKHGMAPPAFLFF